MDEVRFEQLLSGDVPSFEDIAGFISVIERLPYELVWKISTENHKMHRKLHEALSSTLQEKISRENVDKAIDAMAARLLKNRE